MDSIDKKTQINLVTLLAWGIFAVEIYFLGWWFAVASVIASLVVYHLGHSIFAHRHFAHNCYKFSNGVLLFLNLCFLTLNMGSTISYAGLHMTHHKHSGDEQDPHDYLQLGIVRTFLGLWSTETFKIDKLTIRRFFKKPYAKFFHRNYFKFVIPLAIIFAPIAAMTVIWKAFSVIVTHLDIGDTSLRPTKTDTSNNCWWIKPILWGDEAHSNHHRNGSADNLNFDKNWKQFDFLYYIAKGLERV